MKPNKYFAYSATDYSNRVGLANTAGKHFVNTDCMVNGQILPYTFYSTDRDACQKYCAAWSDSKYHGLGLIHQIGGTKMRGQKIMSENN